MCCKACVCVRRVGGMFHALGTCARWWACCPHILGTCKSCPGCVAHAQDSAHPSRTSRMHQRCVPHAGTHSGPSQDVGMACPPCGMCPQHMEHAPEGLTCQTCS